MKRGGPRHPKTCDLAERLGIRRAHAVGHLELLFHFAAEFAPEGDVGRFSDKRIAAALDWGGPPGKLVSALVDSGWLDPHPTARLAVHDWGEHADHTTLQKLSRAGKKPIQSNHEDTAKACDQIETTGSDLIALPLPLPEPEPIPEPVPVPPAARALRALPAAACPIRSQERSITPGGIMPATWESFRDLYSEAGKPCNETDWAKAGMEAATLNLTESDMSERVIPSLAAELPGWAERDIGMIPFPANWLKGQPWTRTAKPRDPQQAREERRQRAIDDAWGGARALR